MPAAPASLARSSAGPIPNHTAWPGTNSHHWFAWSLTLVRKMALCRWAPLGCLSSHLIDVIARDLLITLEDRAQFILADNVFQLFEFPVADLLFDGVDEYIRRRRAVLQHDLAGRWKARGFVGLQCRDRIRLAFEQAAERAGIDDGLRAAVAALRIHGMRGITEQRDAAEGPARQRIAIDHRVGKGEVGVAD